MESENYPGNTLKVNLIVAGGVLIALSKYGMTNVYADLGF